MVDVREYKPRTQPGSKGSSTRTTLALSPCEMRGRFCGGASLPHTRKKTARQGFGQTGPRPRQRRHHRRRRPLCWYIVINVCFYFPFYCSFHIIYIYIYILCFFVFSCRSTTRRQIAGRSGRPRPILVEWTRSSSCPPPSKSRASGSSAPSPRQSTSP